MWEQLVEAWLVNNRISLYLLEKLDPSSLKNAPSPRRGGRDIARQLAHLHSNRIARLERCEPPGHLAKGGARTFASKEELGADELAAAFTESGALVARYIEQASAGRARVKTFKRGLVVAISYLMAHDSHHGATSSSPSRRAARRWTEGARGTGYGTGRSDGVPGATAAGADNTDAAPLSTFVRDLRPALPGGLHAWRLPDARPFHIVWSCPETGYRGEPC